MKMKLRLSLIAITLLGFSKVHAEWMYMSFPFAYTQTGWKFVEPIEGGIWFYGMNDGKWNLVGQQQQDLAPNSIVGYTARLDFSIGVTSLAIIISESTGMYTNTAGGDASFTYVYEKIDETSARIFSLNTFGEVDSIFMTLTSATKGTFSSVSVYDNEIVTATGTITLTAP